MLRALIADFQSFVLCPFSMAAEKGEKSIIKLAVFDDDHLLFLSDAFQESQNSKRSPFFSRWLFASPEFYEHGTNWFRS